MKKTIVYFIFNTKIGLILSLIVLSFLFIFADELQYFPYAHNKISDVSYDNRSDDPEKAKPFSFKVPEKHAKYSMKEYQRNHKNKLIFVKYPIEIKLSMDFEIYTLRDWQNLFQTAPMSNGILMELNKSGGGAVLFGIIEQNGISNFSGYTFSNAFKIGESNHLELSISKYGIFEMNVNGRVMPKGFLEAPFELSLIKAGEGWKQERYFDGKIENFNFEYTCYTKAIWFLWLLRILLALTALALINRFIYKWNIK